VSIRFTVNEYITDWRAIQSQSRTESRQRVHAGAWDRVVAAKETGIDSIPSTRHCRCLKN
jgi:hypothetical protein